MNSSIIKLTPRNSSFLENNKRTPIITIQPRSSMLAKSTINMNNSNANINTNINTNATVNRLNTSTRLNQTTMILSKIIPGKNGEPDSKLSTFIDYQNPTPIRPYTSSELRRITNLGPVPKLPDLSPYFVDREEINTLDDDAASEVLSENSGDSPPENEDNKVEEDVGTIEEEEPEEEIPEVVLSTTHRKDGILYPKLTRPGYYTNPPMDELKEYTEKQLYAVNNFAVRHNTYGSVVWRGSLSDIRSLDLDQIVFLQHGRIEVYPDDIVDKPKQDKLLNKFAEIALNEIWPPKCRESKRESTSEDKENKNENDDVDLTDEQYDMIKKNYGAKLAQHCKDNDCDFIEYDTKKGVWKFSVRHFTIYGLPGAKPATAPVPVLAVKEAVKRVQAKEAIISNVQAPFTMDAAQVQTQAPAAADDLRSHHSHTSMQYPGNSMLQQTQYNNKVGLNEFKNRDIADSFSALINKPYEINPMIIDGNNNEAPHVEDDYDEPIDDESIYDVVDDTHEEIPYDTLIFNEHIMYKKEEKEQPVIAREIDEYYPQSMILKNPNPLTCSQEISKQFEQALQCELDVVLQTSAKHKYVQQEDAKQNEDGLDDVQMIGFGLNRNVYLSLKEYQRLEYDRKMNWQSYDLGFRNKSMFKALMRNGKLYSVMNKQYFQQDKIAFFNEFKESNSIQIHSVGTGLEKIFGTPIYLELINKLLTVHKQYYFDKQTQWNTMCVGDKLQDLTDSYCQQIKNILSYLQNKKNDKIVLAKKILTKFYDALQLILALYAPRCGSGNQSNLKIAAKQIMTHYIDIEEEDDDDHKMIEKPDTNSSVHVLYGDNTSYNELFARKVNLSKWLENVIREDVDNDLQGFDDEIEKVKNGMFDLNENEDEKQEKEEKEQDECMNALDGKEKMSEIEKKEEIARWNDEKIFIMLTANRKLQAADLALNIGDYRLASIISQSSHFAASSAAYQPFLDLRNQIDYWKKQKIWQTFNDSKKKIYALLAGRYVEIVSSAGFNWYRCFGVILWFYLPIHWNLNECISYYEGMCKMKEYPFTVPILNIKNDCKQINKQIKHKQNEIISNNPLSSAVSWSLFTKNELKDKFPNDICFDLLKMKCNAKDDSFDVFKNIFNPRNIEPFKLEYLFNWFIYDLLLETQHIEITNEKQMEICSNIYHSFVEQLERMGYWQWAIYLSLFAQKNRGNIANKYNYNDMAYLILRRSINKSIPSALNSKCIKETKHLNHMTFNDLTTNMDVDDNANNSNNDKQLHYKYCNRSEKFYNEYLKKFWSGILDETIISGLKFLVHIDTDMEEWIIYCLAEYAESRKDWIVAFLSYSQCLKWNKVHEILMNHLFVDWLFEDKIDGELQDTLNQLETNQNKINNWDENGMILFHYIKLMRDIQNNPNQNIETNLNRVNKVKQGINKMLDNLNNIRFDHDNDDSEEEGEEEEDNEDLKKRVCLMTMEQRLDTCVVHLTQNK